MTQQNKRIIIEIFVHGGSQSHCAPEQVWCCTVLTVGKSHALNNSGATRDLSHTVPTITLSIFDAKLSEHPVTDTFTATQILLTTVEQ